MSNENKVLILKCETYKQEKITEIIKRGMKEFGFNPKGKILVKPNVVFAHKRYAKYAYTNPRVLASMISILDKNNNVKDIALGERSGVGLPTRYNFQQAGYFALKKYSKKFRFAFFDEEEQREVILKRSKVHHKLHFAKSLLDADYKIYIPKLKLHVTTKVTCALKLNIGILDTRDRLNKHHYSLEEKIIDLYEVGKPDFIVVDAIDIGEQNELVPTRKKLGVIIMGTNSVAIDTVAVNIYGYSVDDIKYMKAARERGYGPTDLKDIEIIGDTTIEELQKKTLPIDATFGDVLKLDTPINFFLGNTPEIGEVCRGGCMNMLKCALAVAEANRNGSLKNARSINIVQGEYTGEIPNNEFTILIGDCTKLVNSNGNKKIHIKGCPVSVVKFMAPFTFLARVANPYLDIPTMYPFIKANMEYIANKFFINKM